MRHVFVQFASVVFFRCVADSFFFFLMNAVRTPPRELVLSVLFVACFLPIAVCQEQKKISGKRGLSLVSSSACRLAGVVLQSLLRLVSLP